VTQRKLQLKMGYHWRKSKTTLKKRQFQFPPSKSTLQKYFRFFTHTEGDEFAIFVECGLKRNISAEIVSNHTEVLLKVVIPIPEDDLFHHAGLPLWVVFKYELEKDPTEEPIQVEVNLTDLLHPRSEAS